MKISREIKTALLVITSLLLLYVGISYLMSKSIFSNDRIFYAEYDNVGGLMPSTRVYINGFAVGKVKTINLQKNGKSLVTFTMENDFEFSKGSQIQLQENGFIGGKTLAIILKHDGQPMAVSGDTLQALTQPGMIDSFKSQLVPLQGKIESMVVNADSLMTSLNNILNTKTQGNLRKGIEDLSVTMANFKKASNSLNSMLDGNKKKLDTTLTNVAHITTNLSKVSDSLANVEIGKTINELQATVKGLNKIVAGIENGEGSVGKLLKDNKLYDNLSGASKQMEQLLEDMKLNPKRYVHFSLFGKKAKKYEEPKKKDDTTKNN